MKNKYSILFKTGDAEIRAFEKSKFDTSEIFPIIELTRGRKTKYDQIGLISKRIEKLRGIFSKHSICLDLTSSESLSNEEIEDLYKSNRGYENWIKFLVTHKELDYFKEIVPVILVDTTDENLEENLKIQVSSLLKSFRRIAYRSNITDDGYYEDMEAIAEKINLNESEFIFIFDCEYVPSGAVKNTVDLVNARITKIRTLIPKTKFVVISTSFPRYVSDIGNDDYDIFPLNEIDVYRGVKAQNTDVDYGDYGSINPIRNDTVVMARGWIPRIDVPTLDGIYYYRERKNNNDYSTTYSKVARKVYNDSKFPGNLHNWGINQIILSKEGNAPGSAPSFWISVRMSIFVAMQLKRLGLD